MKILLLVNVLKFYIKDQIVYGTVLYKGPIIGRTGIWIGIDLTTPDGDNDGSLKGRVYFRASDLILEFLLQLINVRLASRFQTKVNRKKRIYWKIETFLFIIDEDHIIEL